MGDFSERPSNPATGLTHDVRAVDANVVSEEAQREQLPKAHPNGYVNTRVEFCSKLANDIPVRHDATEVNGREEVPASRKWLGTTEVEV